MHFFTSLVFDCYFSKPYLYAVCFSGPDTPANVSTVVTGSSTVMVSWTPSSSGMCDVLLTGYSIRYRLSSSTGNYTTVNTLGSTTSVRLRDLTPNAEYDVEVAAIFSNGAISNSSLAAHFTVAPTTAALPSEICYYVFLIIYILFYSYILPVIVLKFCIEMCMRVCIRIVHSANALL